MKRTSKTSKATPAILFTALMLAVSGWAFAQGSGIPDSVKDLSGTIRVKDANSNSLAETSATDEPGHYSEGTPYLPNHTPLASRPKYDLMLALDVIDLSDSARNRTLDISTSQKTRLEYKPNATRLVLSWETGAGKSYLIPALEIPGFVLALNGFSRLVLGDETEGGKKVYSTNLSTFWDHIFHSHWGFDRDAFTTNQFLHPYQGTVYHGFARSAGLNFWESLGYTFMGSLLWETAAETTPPSVNDQVASGIAGSFLGEPLFRMASLLIEGAGGEAGFWRELGAAILSPPTAFNRLVFGDRFKAVFPGRDPAIFQRLRLGAGVLTHVSTRDDSTAPRRGQVTSDYTMSYGLPGKPGYSYTRPFDYFQFEFTAVSRAKNPFENILTRGLLFGKKYEVGNAYRGVWGLYGTYDYISPQIFRVSSTAASLGTTAQWWLGPAVALQGTALLGIGYGAAGQIPGEGNRDYHYGAAGQGLLALRLILGDIAMLNLTGRNYYISGLGSTEPRGRETIGRLDGGLTIRIYGRHAFGIQYTISRRDAHYQDGADKRQTPGTLSLVYTLLGESLFGAVEWRTGESR